MDHRARLLFRVGLGPHFQRPEAEPGAQPIIQEIADGAAQPRLISGGRTARAERRSRAFDDWIVFMVRIRSALLTRSHFSAVSFRRKLLAVTRPNLDDPLVPLRIDLRAGRD